MYISIIWILYIIIIGRYQKFNISLTILCFQKHTFGILILLGQHTYKSLNTI